MEEFNDQNAFDEKEQKTFKCEVCNQSFPSSSYLDQHRAYIHKEERSYKCQICDFSTGQTRLKEL